jgi:hypothetical protein
MGSPSRRRRRPRPRPARRPAPPLPRRRRRRWPQRLTLLGAAAALLWLSRGFWWPAPPPPQMILVLGGDKDREIAAADLARSRGLPVVVSGGTNPEYAHWLFQERAGLPSAQVRLDYRAYDTLSNFTSLVDDLRRARIRHALLVTSSDHMPRALLVGRIVAGSRGIRLTPVPVPCGSLCLPEGRRLVWGDGARAALWVLSGRDVRSWVEERLGAWLPPVGEYGSGPGRATR